MKYIGLVPYDKNYPYIITDSWGGRVCMTKEDLKNSPKKSKRFSKRKENKTMKVSHEVFCVNQLTIEEFQALELTEKVLEHLCDMYDDDCRLTSVNDGECILMSELPRVRGILDFVMRNRVVSVEVA